MKGFDKPLKNLNVFHGVWLVRFSCVINSKLMENLITLVISFFVCGGYTLALLS